jgi:probable H4MPT-linked C1 transfer pathway protein
MSTILGWDIGGVNTKVARLDSDGAVAARSYPYELQRDPAALVPLLARAAREILADRGPARPGVRGAVGAHAVGAHAVGAHAVTAHAVTMTAELSQFFRTKREGVGFVLDALAAAFPDGTVRAYAVDGRFLDAAAARRDPLAVAASNWAATARLVARAVPDAILVDVGTTTTDVIPIVGGRIAARGRTDPDRLREGELLYLGALRTPVEAIVHRVPFGGGMAGVSAEGFALAGDVHVWRGALDPACYTVPTPDGRPATRDFAGERLARVVCADREMLDADGVTAIADFVADAQVARIVDAVSRLRDRHAGITAAVVTGLGDFLAAAAAARAGLHLLPLPEALGGAPAQCSAAAAAALLFATTAAV